MGFTILIYDLLLTLGDEVQYIWRRPVTNIKVLYLILRYGVAIAQVVYFQGEARREGVGQTYKVSVAISGLTMHVTHSVSVRLPSLQVDPDGPSCRANTTFCGTRSF